MIKDNESRIEWEQRLVKTFTDNISEINDMIKSSHRDNDKLYIKLINNEDLKYMVLFVEEAITELTNVSREFVIEIIKYSSYLRHLEKQPLYVGHYAAEYWAYDVLDFVIECYEFKNKTE